MLDRLDFLNKASSLAHIAFVCTEHDGKTLDACMEETRRSLESLLWEYSRARKTGGENLFESLCLNRRIIEIKPLAS
jgi:hypothetical protein